MILKSTEGLLITSTHLSDSSGQFSFHTFRSHIHPRPTQLHFTVHIPYLSVSLVYLRAAGVGEMVFYCFYQHRVTYAPKEKEPGVTGYLLLNIAKA